jgi:DNA invertase Pin-like site-specific DNA recombinase
MKGIFGCSLGALGTHRRQDRVRRQKVMVLAQAREIDAILVTELSRLGRSTRDLVQTLDDLHT